MRVCITIRSLTDGGAEKQSILLARALRGEHDVCFVATSPTPCRDKHLRALAELGIEPHFLSGRLGSLGELTRLLRQERVELVLSHLPGDTVLAALAGRRAGVPRIYGGLRNAALAGWKWPVLRWIERHCLTGVVANSQAARREAIARGFDPERLVVVPNGIDVTAPARTREPGEAVRIVGVGRYVEQKDFDTTLRAFGRLQERSPVRCELDLVGRGPLAPVLEARIAELGLADRARLVVDPADMEAVYRRADVYVSTSRFEGLSNAALEAMVASLPLVLTDVGDQALLVEEGINGFVTAPGDAEATAGALERLLDPQRRVAFGLASHRRVVAEYGFERFRERALALVASG